MVRRGVDVDRQLGATVGLHRQRPVRAPDVLADADPDLDAADDVQLERVGLVARREVAGLVEHGVVREQPLAVRAEDLALGADRGGVEQVAVLVDEPDHGRAVPGTGGELGQRGLVVGDEARLDHEVFRRVPGDRQLREGDDVATGFLGAVVGIDQLGHVAIEIADGGVELRQRDTHHGHNSRLVAPSSGHPETRRMLDCRGGPSGGTAGHRAAPAARLPRDLRGRAARRPPGADRGGQPGGQRRHRPRPRRRPGPGGGRGRGGRQGRGPRPARRVGDRAQGPHGDRRLPDHLRLAPVRRLPPAGRQPRRGPDAGRRRGRRREDQHARVRRRLAHVQPAARRHAQPVGPRPLGRRVERRGRRRPGVRDGRHRRRQRHGRLVAQPGGVEQRGRLPPDATRRADASAPATRGTRWRSMVRWAARSATSPCCSACSVGRPNPPTRCTGRSPCRPTSTRPTARCAWRGRATSAGRRWTPGRSRCSTASARRSRGSDGRSSTTSPTSAAPTTASGRCGRGSRPPARRPASARGPAS